MTIAKQPAIPFAAGAVIARVKGFAAGRQPARARHVKLPPPVQPIPAQPIRAIRPGLGCTQTGFATLLNVPTMTAISWENGTRKPSGAALRLLAVARRRSMRRKDMESQQEYSPDPFLFAMSMAGFTSLRLGSRPTRPSPRSSASPRKYGVAKSSTSQRGSNEGTLRNT